MLFDTKILTNVSLTRDITYIHHNGIQTATVTPPTPNVGILFISLQSG